MQIKDILRILVDDGLVRCEKCGIANLYWSFSYAAQLQLDTQYKKTLSQLESSMEGNNVLTEMINVVQDTKSGDEWDAQFNLQTQYQLKVNDLNNQLLKLRENSHENIHKLQLGLVRLEMGIDILIDNITLIVNYINVNNGLGKDEIYKAFNIPIDL